MLVRGAHFKMHTGILHLAIVKGGGLSYGQSFEEKLWSGMVGNARKKIILRQTSETLIMNCLTNCPVNGFLGDEVVTIQC